MKVTATLAAFVAVCLVSALALPTKIGENDEHTRQKRGLLLGAAALGAGALGAGALAGGALAGGALAGGVLAGKALAAKHYLHHSQPYYYSEPVYYSAPVHHVHYVEQPVVYHHSYAPAHSHGYEHGYEHSYGHGGWW